jgi:integrase/recombinase XerD
VVAVDESVPWLVVDDAGVAVEPICRYLGDLAARRRSASSARSYAYDLLRWWRWLGVIGIDWDKTTSADVKDFVLWLLSTTKQWDAPRTRSAATAGTINPITRKRCLDDRYQARTVRHSNAVLRDFCEF